MNPQSLEKNLNNIERELVNLQTAHEVGLGMVGFYEYSGTHDTIPTGGGFEGQAFILMIDVADGERVDPIVDIYITSIYGSNTSGFASAERLSSIKYDVAEYRPFYAQAIPMAYRIISTSKLSVAVANSVQEYEDWLNG